MKLLKLAPLFAVLAIAVCGEDYADQTGSTNTGGTPPGSTTTAPPANNTSPAGAPATPARPANPQ